MKKRDTILSIIIVAIFILAVICTVRTSTMGRRLSELEAEWQQSCNVSVSVTCAPTLPLRGKAINVSNADIGQDHLQANNQLDLSTDPENIATPEICASQWLQDTIAAKETLACIEEYVKNEQIRIRGQEP